jgi:hypothetical protein
VLAKGSYWIRAQAVNFEDVNLSFDQRSSFCETFTLHLTVSPLKSATQLWRADTEEEFCEGQTYLANQLTLDEVVRGEITHELSTMNTDVGYFDFSKGQKEGPFLIYFQLDYDPAQEGIVGLALSQYDSDSSSFRETALYSLTDSQSMVLKIVEKGTYAVSIQSIASSRKKFQQLGLSRGKLSRLPVHPSNCFKGAFTYLVASINEKDSAGDEFALLNMMGLVPYEQMLERVVVMETADDLRNLREFASCNYDEMPRRFPISDEGFDRQYTFQVSSSTSEIIDLVLEEPSVVKVFVNARNTKNKIKAQLHRPGRATKDGRPLAQTDPVDNELVAVVKDAKAAYHLKMVYSYLDPSDTCPLYDLHVAVKAVADVADEDLKCEQNDLPPAHLKIDKSIFKLRETYAFSYEYLRGESDAATGELAYDVFIDFPHSDYFFDFELKSDFLTANLRLELFALDPTSEDPAYAKIATSHWFDEHSKDDSSSAGADNEDLVVGEKTMVQRLRYLEDDMPDFLGDASQLMLRIKVRPDSQKVVEGLAKYGGVEPEHDSLCFNFDLSFYAHEELEATVNDANMNKLIRVDWVGAQESSGKFDVTKAVTAILEYEKSLAQHAPLISANYADIYLQPVTKTGKEENSKKKVNPSSFKLKSSEDSVLMLFFSPFAMEKGQCYQIRVQFTSTLANFMTAEIEAGDDMTVCTSKCNCDPTGTKECIEGESWRKAPTCVCHRDYEGLDCGTCAAGFFKNDDGYCEKEAKCADEGGDVDCNGHGTCMQEGPIARCECHQGFSDDGLDQCGRCSDPLFNYPEECDQRRQWVLEQDDYECSELPNLMPTRLFKRPSEPDSRRTIYQQENGELEWSGRYALRSKTNRRAVSVSSDTNDKT